jgi:CNT family concentrative nucleoside transporter
MFTDGTSGDLAGLGLVFAFHVLPTIIFFGALMSVLYHLNVVQVVVRGIAWVMQRAMKTSGAESLSVAGNIFVGQTEAPLLIKPYVGDMTMSELMAVMCGGFATIAGGVLAAYVRFGIDAGHLLAASVMSAPAALVCAKLLWPETETPKTAGGAVQRIEKTTANLIDAAATGAADGLRLAANVAAMLIAFIALIALLNGALGAVGSLLDADLSLRSIFGVVFYPLSWCMGVSPQDLTAFGNLLGTKIAINEFVAYVELGAEKATMTPRSFTIATYALCGFANFSSIGIQIGGISAIAPTRRTDLARLGLKAMIGGAAASWLTACVAGILL